MTHTEDLIFRLRDTASRGVSSWGDLQQEAADGLEALIDMQTLDGILIQNLTEQLSAERLATELAVDAEREACVRLIETTDLSNIPDPAMQKWIAEMLFTYAGAIRARGQA